MSQVVRKTFTRLRVEESQSFYEFHKKNIFIKHNFLEIWKLFEADYIVNVQHIGVWVTPFSAMKTRTHTHTQNTRNPEEEKKLLLLTSI